VSSVYKRIFMILSLTYLTGCGSILATFESNSIEDEPGERSLAEQVLDESIETKAIVNIRAANAAFDDLGFLVVSYNGYVLIAGEVPNQGLKDEASAVVREIEGVRRIYNELVIGPKSTSGTEANDVWLTTKIKTALLTDSEVPSLRVKVVTENSVVYLMGLLSTEEANRTAAAAADVDGVTRVVRLFELI
jgi:osmotically-inducible protein OsmY